MPNRDVHRPVGMVAGAGYSFHRARRRYQDRPSPAAPIIAETLGGIAGGWLGGASPDWIDPPTSPNHRHFGHGTATVVGTVWLTTDAIFKLQEQLRERADLLQANRGYLESDFLRALSIAEEFIIRFAAGLLNGFTAGYISHLFLDLLTPSGLPLVARGF